MEVGEKKDRVTDALNATKAAVEEGIVPGARHDVVSEPSMKATLADGLGHCGLAFVIMAHVSVPRSRNPCHDSSRSVSCCTPSL